MRDTPSFHGETPDVRKQILLPLTPHEYQYIIDCVAFHVACSRHDTVLVIAINSKINNGHLATSDTGISDLFEKFNKITNATVPPDDIVAI